MEENFHKEEVNGVTFYVRNEMTDKAFLIDWFGVWIFGAPVVKEIQ